MATFMRFGGERGLNVDALAEWEYSEKSAPKPPSRAHAANDLPDSAPTPMLKLTFTDGHILAIEGEYATALHRYFRSVGSALT